MKDLENEDFNNTETLIKQKYNTKVNLCTLKRDNRIVGHILVFQDITKQHRLEAMRKSSANVSHELRTPLTTIKSYTETLLDGALEEPEVSRQFMDVVNNEADRMTRLVTTFWNFRDLITRKLDGI